MQLPLILLCQGYEQLLYQLVREGRDMIIVSVNDVADSVLKDIILNKEPRPDKKQRKDKRYQEMIKLAYKIRSRLNIIKTFEHFKMLETYRSWYPHPLDDNREGYWSVRLKKDNPYRLIFQYDEDENALKLIDFLDYHKDRRNRR